jgi:hypothetical protein
MPIPVGNLTTFGLSKEEALKQIWQMLVDSRDGTAPFHVTTGAPSNTSNDGVSIGITTFGISEAMLIQQIWQMFYDARTGSVPFVVISV